VDVTNKPAFDSAFANRPRPEPLPQAEENGAAAGHVDIGPLAHMTGYVLRRAQLAVFDEVIRNFAQLNLRPSQYSVLLVLQHSPGLKQSDVAAALGIQRANFVALFDGLERRGLAQRLPAPNDRRSYALYLTEAGSELLKRANKIQDEMEARLTEQLGPGGREQLLALLRRIIPRS
jgi:DNA-binding MarR family transcriptional regulator